MPTQDQARRRLQELIDSYNSRNDRRELSEADVIDHYVRPLLREVLGWPFDPDHFRNEYSLSNGRVDMRLIADNTEILFVEAKKFEVIQKLENMTRERARGEIRMRETRENRRLWMTDVIRPTQLSLPGVAVDRTREEQQAINYAFQNNGKWAILTNFERLRLFNARRDWLVFSFESPAAYLEDFDFLWQLSYESVMRGSLDNLSNERYREDVDSSYLNFINEWRETLANDIRNHADNNRWAFHEDGSFNLLLVRGVVQRVIDRLVVIRFAEDHLVIPAGTLYTMFETRQNNPYTFSMQQFISQYFRRFDDLHNSALFVFDVTDAAQFSDEVLENLILDLYLAKYRAMPADILGNTYEQYLGKALALDNGAITTRDNLETRKKQGSYYTPQVIVRYLVDNSLGRYLYGTSNGQPDGEPLAGETRKTSREIQNLRVLDSACGSGSFLINAYYVLENFYKAELERLEAQILTKAQRLAAEGKSRIDIELEIVEDRAEVERIRYYPHLILETHLYGTDLDPQAAEIAVVNLIMRAMERQGAQKILPLILNQNVKIGNALIGLRYDDPRLLQHGAKLAEIRRLRLQLIQTDNADPQHDTIVETLARLRDELYSCFQADFARHFSDLERARPFHWGIEFPEVFYDETGKLLDKPGFDVIIGNPPWEIVKPEIREFYAQYDETLSDRRVAGNEVERRIAELNAENTNRKSQWEAFKLHIEEQAAYYSDIRDFMKQGNGDRATHKLFTERMYQMLKPKGLIGYVVPAGIYADSGTQSLREMLLMDGCIHYLYGLSNERFFFPGVHHGFKFALFGAQKGATNHGFWVTFRINPRVAVAPNDFPQFMLNKANFVFLENEAIKRYSPDDLTILEFETHALYQVLEKMFQFPPLGKNEAWGLDFAREFDMSNDKRHFNERQEGYPLYEGKMVHQFNPYFAAPRYWINAQIGYENLTDRYRQWHKRYRFAFREVAGAVNERTCIASVLPPNTFAGHTLWVGITPSAKKTLWYVAMVNSLCVDWLARLKVNLHVTLSIMKALPIALLNENNPYFDALILRAARLTCTRPEFADLWQEVMGTAWGEHQAVTNPAERQQLRNEIDAIVAHLYGLSRAEFNHILGTFPLVFPDTDEGRQKRETLLAVYDAWAVKTQGWSRE